MDAAIYENVPAYARLSRKSRGGRVESIPLQFSTLERLAEWGGHSIGARFDDKALSAWDESVHRAGWEAFLAELDTGSHRAAFSYHADRLSRNGMDCERLLQIGARHEIMLLTPEGVYDLGNGDSRAMFRHLAAMTINQSDATSRRARNHKDEARRQGNLRIVYGGRPPLGFRQGEDDWQVDGEQAAYLAEAAKRVLSGESVLAVHRTMPAIADSSGRIVTDKMLRNALTRPASAGLLTGRDGEVVSRAPGGGPLSEEMFDRLRRLFAGRQVGRPAGAATADDQGRARYPFGPVLRCDNCGNQLTGGPGYKGRDYYGCKNPHKALGVLRPCRGVSVAAEDVHVLIRDAVLIWAATPAARLAAAQVPETGGRRAELETRIAEAQGWLADIMEKRQRRYISPYRAEQLEFEVKIQIDADAAELAELERIDAQPGIPVVIDWDSMTDAEKLRTLTEAIQTPIKVKPGNGGGAAISAADRISLVPR
jgi:DNA invertase Pin-like site-specific DNA recombinase